MNEDNVFAALASTPRRKILAYLSQTSLTAGEIAARFEMTKPSLSRHLQVLEHAGLVVGEKRGQFVHYRLADGRLLVTLHDFLMGLCPVGGPLRQESAAMAAARPEVSRSRAHGAHRPSSMAAVPPGPPAVPAGQPSPSTF